MLFRCFFFVEALYSTPPLLRPTLLYRYCTLLYSPSRLIYSTLTLLQSTLLATLYSTPTAPFSTCAATPPLLHPSLLRPYPTPPLLHPSQLHLCSALLATPANAKVLAREAGNAARTRAAPASPETSDAEEPAATGYRHCCVGVGSWTHGQDEKSQECLASRLRCAAPPPNSERRASRPEAAPRTLEIRTRSAGSCIFEHGPLEHTAHAHFAKWWRQTGNRRRLCSLESGQSTAAVV